MTVPVALPNWLQQLRRTEIVDRVHHDARSAADRPLGLTRDAAIQAAGWGQALFDEPMGDLSPLDRALLYAYFLQLGHIEELITACRQLFDGAERLENPVVLDLGCGPFTGGLAVASELGQRSRFEYLGIDQSQAMCDLGARLATAAASLAETPQIDHRWARRIESITWSSAPGWRPVLVIVSYLLASPTVDPAALIAELEGLLERIGRGSVTVLYTNSVRPTPNLAFPTFRSALCRVGFDLIADDAGAIAVSRMTGTRTRELRYALFHRQKRTTLRLRRS